MKKIQIILIVTVLLCSSLFSDEKMSSLKVIVTTSWTASFAKAAGAEDITILAPVEMAHPPEYELKPSDIQALSEADVIIYAGYEGMVDKIVQTAASKNINTVKIDTDNNLNTIKSSIRAISGELGTEEYGENSITEISNFFEDWINELKSEELYGKQVTVHKFQRRLAENLGFVTETEYGPAPAEAKDLLEIRNNNSPIIIDNIHGPVGRALRDILPGTDYVLFRNFPSDPEEVSLLDILKENRTSLMRL